MAPCLDSQMETNVTWNHLSPSKQRLYTLQILVLLGSMARQPQRMRALHPSASRPTLALIGTNPTRRLPPMQQRFLHSRSTHRLRLRRLYPSQAFQFLSSARQRRHLHRSTRFHVTLTSNTSGNPASTSSTRQTCAPGRRSSPHALPAPKRNRHQTLRVH